MITNPYKYVQLGVGSTKVKRRIVDTSTLSHILDFSQSNYRSWVLFDHDLQKHFKTMKSVKGYNGKSSSEYFPIDIDNEGNLDESLRVCRTLAIDLVENLDIDPRILQIYFSGSKGFHLQIPSDLFGDTSVDRQNELCYRFKWIMQQLDHPVDMAIYKTNMLWRIQNTPHEKTGLYKIPLKYHELCSLNIDDIRKLAESPRDISWIDGSEWGINEALSILWSNSRNAFQSINKKAIQYNTRSSGKLQFHNTGTGSRNESCFNNALAAKSNGLSMAQTKELLLNWNNNNFPPLSKYEVNKTVEQAFRYIHSSSQDTNLKVHFREDPIVQRFVPRDYIIYVDLLCRLNTVTKIWHGISIHPNQQVISYRSVADRLTRSKRKEDKIDQHRVERLVKMLEKEGRISREIVLDQNDQRRTRITWLGIDTNETRV